MTSRRLTEKNLEEYHQAIEAVEKNIYPRDKIDDKEFKNTVEQAKIAYQKYRKEGFEKAKLKARIELFKAMFGEVEDEEREGNA